MNSRPLCLLSNDPLDFHCFTAFPDKNLTDMPENRLKIWRKCSRLQQMFSKKQSIDYLNRLQNRPKWLFPAKNVKVNGLVLLREDTVPPLNWLLVRIVEVHEGSNGKVRVVKSRTPGGVTSSQLVNSLMVSALIWNSCSFSCALFPHIKICSLLFRNYHWFRLYTQFLNMNSCACCIIFSQQLHFEAEEKPIQTYPH